MKFYNCTNVLAELLRVQKLPSRDYSRLIVITGRSQIDKMSSIMKSVEGLLTIYLFAVQRSEVILCLTGKVGSLKKLLSKHRIEMLCLSLEEM